MFTSPAAPLLAGRFLSYSCALSARVPSPASLTPVRPRPACLLASAAGGRSSCPSIGASILVPVAFNGDSSRDGGDFVHHPWPQAPCIRAAWAALQVCGVRHGRVSCMHCLWHACMFLHRAQGRHVPHGWDPCLSGEAHASASMDAWEAATTMNPSPTRPAFPEAPKRRRVDIVHHSALPMFYYYKASTTMTSSYIFYNGACFLDDHRPYSPTRYSRGLLRMFSRSDSDLASLAPEDLPSRGCVHRSFASG